MSTSVILLFCPKFANWARNNSSYTFFAGSPSGNNLTPVGPCRYDSSLGMRNSPMLVLLSFFCAPCRIHVFA